jgi:hypothetical protein
MRDLWNITQRRSGTKAKKKKRNKKVYLPRNCRNHSVHISDIQREQIRETYVVELALLFTLNFGIASLNFSNGKHE